MQIEVNTGGGGIGSHRSPPAFKLTGQAAVEEWVCWVSGVGLGKGWGNGVAALARANGALPTTHHTQPPLLFHPVLSLNVVAHRT